MTNLVTIRDPNTAWTTEQQRRIVQVFTQYYTLGILHQCAAEEVKELEPEQDFLQICQLDLLLMTRVFDMKILKAAGFGMASTKDASFCRMTIRDVDFSLLSTRALNPDFLRQCQAGLNFSLIPNLAIPKTVVRDGVFPYPKYRWQGSDKARQGLATMYHGLIFARAYFSQLINDPGEELAYLKHIFAAEYHEKALAWYHCACVVKTPTFFQEYGATSFDRIRKDGGFGPSAKQVSGGTKKTRVSFHNIQK